MKTSLAHADTVEVTHHSGDYTVYVTRLHYSADAQHFQATTKKFVFITMPLTLLILQQLSAKPLPTFNVHLVQNTRLLKESRHE